MRKNEKVLSSEYLFKGKVVVLRQDTICLPNGKQVKREIVEHDPAVVIVPFQPPHSLYLIRQYRRATKKWILEVPAGIMDPQETPLEAAQRELREETGFHASYWEALTQGYPSPGFCDEYMYFYLAQDLKAGPTQFDEDEQIELVLYNFEDIESMIYKQEIVDLKTILAFTWLKLRLQK